MLMSMALYILKRNGMNWIGRLTVNRINCQADQGVLTVPVHLHTITNYMYLYGIAFDSSNSISYQIYDAFICHTCYEEVSGIQCVIVNHWFRYTRKSWGWDNDQKSKGASIWIWGDVPVGKSLSVCWKFHFCPIFEIGKNLSVRKNRKVVEEAERSHQTHKKTMSKSNWGHEGNVRTYVTNCINFHVDCHVY